MLNNYLPCKLIGKAFHLHLRQKSNQYVEQLIFYKNDLKNGHNLSRERAGNIGFRNFLEYLANKSLSLFSLIEPCLY